MTCIFGGGEIGSEGDVAVTWWVEGEFGRWLALSLLPQLVGSPCLSPPAVRVRQNKAPKRRRAPEAQGQPSSSHNSSTGDISAGIFSIMSQH